MFQGLTNETDSTAYGYDNNGSLTAKTIRNGSNVITESDTYGYDLRNRMTSATINGITTSYVYGSNGVRVSETTGSNATFYLNDPQNPTGYTKVVEESTSADSTTPSRSYLIGSQVIAQSDSSGVLYLMHDGHGSTPALLTSTGAIFSAGTTQERYDYDAYGTMLSSANGQSIAASAKTLWLFANDGIVDPVTGWRYNLARYVNGFWFTQVDIQRAGENSDPITLHKYLYANSTSVNGLISMVI